VYVRALQSANVDVDPSVLQREADQAMPEVREGIAFSNKLSDLEAAKDVTPSMRLPSTRFLQGLAMSLVLGLLLILTVAVFMWMQIQKEVEPKTVTGFIPAQELPVVQAPVASLQESNLLPALPQTITPEGMVPGWRYRVEEGPLQHVSTGLRSGAITTCFTHDQFLRLEFSSPFIALSGPDNQAMRIRSRVRRSDDFNGTVGVTLFMLTKKEDGTYEPLKTSSFDVRDSRGEPAGALSLNRKITLAKRATHIQFSIVTTFKGTLDIEQPVLIGEKDD